MEVYLSGSKGQRELGIRCVIIFLPYWNFYRMLNQNVYSVCETVMQGKALSDTFSLTPMVPFFIWKEQCQLIMNYFLFKAASQIFGSH